MITASNFKSVLLQLGFSQKGNIFHQDFPAVDAYLRVNFDKEELIYPEDRGLKINERQTCNFKANENFVVFECVSRLFAKGYRPRHIELEPRWQVGHGASGGRADILIRDNDGKTLLIIECKTWGEEFNNAWKDTLNGKGQLFTYAHQERNTRYLCLYASGFEDGGIKPVSHLIAVYDNEDILKRKAAENPPTYRDADSARALYEVWRRTYESDYATRGIFEADVQPYQIGKAKYTVDDLQIVSEADIQPKYHEFATILRQHNVSGRENAFDKLVNLFLCKIVDEKHNPEDLQFYWRGVAFDNYFELIDRLQRLYRNGMREFLKEDVTYIDNETIRDAFKFFRNDPDATREKILDYFRRQKYFTNNDFSFLDVHNEQLFYQNAAILLKIVRMIQDIKLNGDQQNQFLGDMFEFFLDQGFKQTEGQFFTPMPVTRFIILSLPLETVFMDGKNPPKVVDYACGAGHFLTEMASQLRHLRGMRDARVFYRQFYGIEKEYRLSKVAKVSAFMYNQDEINIIYADALAELPEIVDNTFSLLVSNPPYSVKGFLETLTETERGRYELVKTVDAKSYPTHNAIEAFFVERAKQLLASHGVAGVITPSSILSNASAVYVSIREILLQHFDIVALVELGSGTFGKTGTNTVTLFLRRKDDNPAPSKHYHNRVAAWFDGDTGKDAVFADTRLLKAYCDHIGIPLDEYRTLLQGNPSRTLLDTEIFRDYRRVFHAGSEVKALQRKKSFLQKSAEEQQAELDKRFTAYARTIERDKAYYFLLAYTQSCPVVVVRSPQGTDGMKKFLGYEWSAAKGQEGIKYLRGSIDRIETPLFDPQNRNHPEKISTLIRRNFSGQDVTVPQPLQPYVTVARLVDLLDFSRAAFDKQISLAPKKVAAQAESKWEIMKLSELVYIIGGGTPDTTNEMYWGGSIPWLTVNDFGSVIRFVHSAEKSITQEGLQNSSTKILEPGDLIISARGTVGALAQLAKPMAFNQSCYGLRSKGRISNDYLFYVLRHEIQQLKTKATGSKFDAITTKTFDEVKIPVPPPDVQARIVAYCQAIDGEVEQATATIYAAHNSIQNLVNGVYVSNAAQREIDSLVTDVQYGLSKKMNESGIGYKIFRMNEILHGRMVDNGSMKCVDISAEEFNKYRLNKGDILFNRTNSIEHVGKAGLFDLDGDYCFASYLIRIIPNPQKVSPLFLSLMMNSETFQQEAKSKAARAINQANINATVMRHIKVPVPALDEQLRIVTEFEIYEQDIAQAEAVIAAAPEQRLAVLKAYL